MPLVRRTACLLLAALTAVVTCSCHSGSSTPTEPSTTAVITIASAMPPAGTVLTAGTSVTFTATATYNLPVAGSIVLVIEDQNYDNLSTTNPAASAQVGAGTGTVTLSDRITLPPSGVTQVDLFVLLASAPVQNISVSSIAQETVYPVH